MKKCCKWLERCKLVPEKYTKPVKLFVETPGFEIAVVIFIGLNSIVLGTEHYMQPDWLTKVQ